MILSTLHQWAALLAYAMLPIALIIPLEVLAPRTAPSWGGRVRGFAIQGLAFIPAAMLFSAALNRWFHGVQPLIPPAVWLKHPFTAAALIVLLWDFTFYVLHRVQHRFFWRWHAVHHAIEDLGAVNSYNHPSELVFEWVAMSLPIMIFGLAPTLLFRLLAALQAAYLHSGTRLNFGPLRWVFNDNRHHRIHHSREPEHFDKNFSLFFPFWDLVFGTAHMHEPEAWPRPGVIGLPAARNPLDYLLHPVSRASLPALQDGERRVGNPAASE
jgi:sterol desaturase/sphingolipid hydroxylase (fatty acid hydroxylase superfamily)